MPRRRLLIAAIAGALSLVSAAVAFAAPRRAPVPDADQLAMLVERVKGLGYDPARLELPVPLRR